MILTSDEDGNKVHFPMPLNFIEEPDITTLRRTLSRMQSQFDQENEDVFNDNMMSRSMTDFSKIDVENEKLREEIQEMERSFAATYGDNFYSAS